MTHVATSAHLKHVRLDYFGSFGEKIVPGLDTSSQQTQIESMRTDFHNINSPAMVVPG